MEKSKLTNIFLGIIAGALVILALTTLNQWFTSSGLKYKTIETARNILPKSQLEGPVRLTEKGFNPDRIYVHKGTKVLFLNEDRFDHDIVLTSCMKGTVHIPRISLGVGQSASIVLDSPASCELYDSLMGPNYGTAVLEVE